MSFPRYPAYKDSGVEWLGEVPAHWSASRLKHSAQIVTDRLDTKPEDSVYLGLENIESQTGRLLIEATAEQVESVVGVFQAGDVLFGKLRPYLAKVVQPDFGGVCTTELLTIRGENIDGHYLYYQLLSEPVIKLIDSYTYGSKMPRVNAEQVGNTVFPLPPLPEQRAIAAFLDAETARIDALVAKQEALIATLQEKRRALISHAVTKGLDPAAPMRDSGVPWLGEVPAHWEVLHLRRVLESLDYGISESLTADEGVAILRMGDVSEGKIRLDKVGFVEQVAPELLLSPGDLLFNRTNSLDQVGKVGLYRGGASSPLSFASYLVRLRCKDAVLPEYLNFALNAPGSLAWARGEALPSIGQANLNPNRYSYLPIPLPPVHEQKAILAHLNCNLSQLDTLIAKAQAFIGLLREHRTALIAAAVTGQIDVRGSVGAAPRGEVG